MKKTPFQIIQQVKDNYNTISESFAETRKKKLWPEISSFVGLVKSGMRVLDVGCGSGRLLSELKNKKVDYLGLDFSKELISQAKKRFSSRKFLLRDVSKNDGWARIGVYDAIFCLGVLHHIPDRETQNLVIQQIYAHTNPGGIVVISVWNLWQWRFWKYHLKQIKSKIVNGNFSYVWIPYSVSDGKKPIKTVSRFCKAFFAGELISLVKQAGFTIDTYYYADGSQTRMSILKGRNFCLLARKKVE